MPFLQYNRMPHCFNPSVPKIVMQIFGPALIFCMEYYLIQSLWSCSSVLITLSFFTFLFVLFCLFSDFIILLFKKYLSTRFCPGSFQLLCIFLPLLLSSPFCSVPTVLSYHSCPAFPVSYFPEQLLHSFRLPLLPAQHPAQRFFLLLTPVLSLAVRPVSFPVFLCCPVCAVLSIMSCLFCPVCTFLPVSIF
jgi:hypothetical protein